MSETKYRIGITTDEKLLKRSIVENNEILIYTMSRNDAPFEWHSSIEKEFFANSWVNACEIYDKFLYLKKFRIKNEI